MTIDQRTPPLPDDPVRRGPHAGRPAGIALRPEPILALLAVAIVAGGAVLWLQPGLETRAEAADQRLLDELHAEVAPVVTRPLTLTVIERKVLLQGEVSSEDERTALLDIAAAHPGVVDVEDGLVVATPVPDGVSATFGGRAR